MIMAFLSGTDDLTLEGFYTYHNYSPREIYWGHKFQDMIDFDKDTNEVTIDYTKVNAVERCANAKRSGA